MSNRTNIYYWKCDRPDSFATLGKKWYGPEREQLETSLYKLCGTIFDDGDYTLEKTLGQGNHRNYIVTHKGKPYLIRVENSHDKDDYMIVETEVIRRVAALGIPVPHIICVDTSRTTYPFTFQIMEYYSMPDINGIYKKGELDTAAIMYQLGRLIARWQDVFTDGFGLFNTDLLRCEGILKGLCDTYPDYYKLNLDIHLDFLVDRNFISSSFAGEIRTAINKHAGLLELGCGCLVHKDIAFWNILGTNDCIESVIDWDDTIMGDPTDDLSLMACYHSWKELRLLLEGYQAEKLLPENFEGRFWMHLLRNILFKAVIRVGAGYFDKDRKFFLIEQDGNGLKVFTHARLVAAFEGLRGNIKISDL